MLVLEKLIIKNFLSIGNVRQQINFNNSNLTLVLGENLDSGSGQGYRNGVGKTTIIQAICYALYGQPLTQIKKDNLINKTNGKNMYVKLYFSKNNSKYIIRRGRRPNFLKWIVNNNLVNNQNSDRSEGDSRQTQKEIEKTIGMSIQLFKNIVALNTFTEPFLSLPISGQRQIIRELLGITRLSTKAEILKEKIRNTKELIREEEIKILSQKESNAKIQKSIEDLQKKSTLFRKEKTRKICELEKLIKNLREINIEEEIQNHQILNKYDQLNIELRTKKELLREKLKLYNITEKEHNKLKNDLEQLLNKICPVCNQKIKNGEHQNLLENIKINICEKIKILEKLSIEKSKIEEEILLLEEEIKNINKPVTFYKLIDDAYNHKSKLEILEKELLQVKNTKNTFIRQIEYLKENSIVNIDYSNLNNLNNILNHQETLLKFLVNKDSFIRKRLIDQNLNYLNSRLKFYCKMLNLNHEVKFRNDLSVTITELGLDYDFDNLSRGERTRLILALSWAFRDIFEILNFPINIMLVDELIDNGLDIIGVRCALQTLKNISRERNKNIFLISHREELINRVHSVLMVYKEKGFTTLQQE